MEKTTTKSKTNKALLDMGYSQSIIDYAFTQVHNYNVEHMLELIISKEALYETLFSNVEEPGVIDNPFVDNEPENNNNKEENPINSQNTGKGKKEKKRNRKKSKAEKALQKQEILPSDEEDEENYDSDEDNKSRKYMDEETISYIDDLLDTFNVRRNFSIINPNWYIRELLDQLQSLQFKTSDEAGRVRKFLEMPGHFPKIVELKKMVYSTILKIMNMNFGKKSKPNLEGFNSLISLSLELGMLKNDQVQQISKQYQKFASKCEEKPTEDVLEKLKKYGEVQEDEQKGNALDNEEKDVSNPNTGEEIEEGKPEGIDIYDEIESAKEYCIVCMERIREIVFLPCSHFVTCPLCSQRIRKCPVCNEHVEKGLKLFWS